MSFITSHPQYGQRLTRSQKVTLFGDSHADDHKGIVQRDGKVVWILVQTGEKQTYPNEVTPTHVKYCYSKDGKANNAMKRAYEAGYPFMVKVVPDKSPDTYLWGYGVIDVLQEDHESNGRMYRRFVITRDETARSPIYVPTPVVAPVTAPVFVPTNGEPILTNQLGKMGDTLRNNVYHRRWSRLASTFFSSRFIFAGKK